MQITTKLEIMRFKLRDYITDKFIYAYDMMENDFFRTAIRYIKCELLRANDPGITETAHWSNAEVARHASEVATLKTVSMNCFKMTDKSSKKRSDIILSTEFSR